MHDFVSWHAGLGGLPVDHLGGDLLSPENHAKCAYELCFVGGEFTLVECSRVMRFTRDAPAVVLVGSRVGVTRDGSRSVVVLLWHVF
jgi:hypothetical protein